MKEDKYIKEVSSLKADLAQAKASGGPGKKISGLMQLPPASNIQ